AAGPLRDGLAERGVEDRRAAADGAGSDIEGEAHAVTACLRSPQPPMTATSTRPMRTLTVAAGRPELICRLSPATAIDASRSAAMATWIGLWRASQLARKAM